MEKVPLKFSSPDTPQDCVSPPDPLTTEHLRIPNPADPDITQPVHYTESESTQARLSLAKTDEFLQPVLNIAKLNALVEPHLANSRLQSYLKGNARMFAQYLIHLKNKLPTFKMFRKTWRNLRLCNGQFNSVKLNCKKVKKIVTN